jgi:hypothetical protein
MESRQPWSSVSSVEGEDLEDLLTMANPRFWEMIEDRRRKNGSATLAEVRARYGVPKLPRQHQRRTKGAAPRLSGASSA